MIWLLMCVTLLSGCLFAGAPGRGRVQLGLQPTVPVLLNTLVPVAEQTRLSARRLVWQYGQPRILADGRILAVNRTLSQTYTAYANRMEECCTSAVYHIEQGVFSVTADIDPGPGVLSGNNTGTLRIHNADTRTARTLIESITLAIPPAAPNRQTMQVLFYTFWQPLPGTARLEDGDYLALLFAQHASLLPLFSGRELRFDVAKVLPPAPAFVPVFAPDGEVLAVIDPAADAPAPGDADPGGAAPGDADPGGAAPGDDDPGGVDPADNAPAPVEADFDGDGVPNVRDLCPAEADLGYGLTSRGCPLRPDSDNDGFWDELDYCPADGDLGAGIDRFGCPLPIDSDGDGIIDDEDYCPDDGDTGRGVDALGCPPDE
jgi:hypothetical protein